MKGAVDKLPLVSIIVLNWNRPLDTLECIKSLKHQTYLNIEIIIVDNGSVDNSKELLGDIKDITLIENSTNRGFTGGHIDGLAHAKGDFIFILNNDAVVDKDYVKNAVSIFEKDDSIAVVGGRSYQWDTEDQVYNTNSPFYSFQTINRLSMEGIFSQTDAGYDHEVNWVSGSAMIIRKEAIKKAGYLYDPMFAYYEESDFLARIQACDYTIVYSPSLRIWHKNGISSSSFFQFYQLFKNRFVYGLRNLESKDLIRFLESYVKTTLRGSYHNLMRRSKTDDERVMNSALQRALGHSIATWPRWAMSRKQVVKRDSHGYNLSDRLKIEQTGISFVCDLSKDISKVTLLVDFIKTIAYKHYNSELVIVCNRSDELSLSKLIDSSSISKLNVRIATNANLSEANPVNIGWLSASKDYVWFIDTSYQPTVESVNRACVNIGDSEFGLYAESPSRIIPKHISSIKLSRNLCVSRTILAAYGGIDNDRIEQATVNLLYFAQLLQKASIYIGDYLGKDLVEYKISPETKSKADLTIRVLKDQAHTSSLYAKVLSKYYRLYQLHNISTWLLIREIPSRHKMARIRNSLLAATSLNRKRLALELKHINNEVVKLRHSVFNRDKRVQEILGKIDNSLTDDNWKKTPVLIICRDRLSPLEDLLKWLKLVDMTNIILIDNASIYPALVEFYKTTPYQVIRTNKNIGHTVVWKEGFAKTLFPGQFYIVSDPDVVPDKKAPKDSIKYFYQLHKKYVDFQKVGFGLQIDDLPDYYALKPSVIEWEGQFWKSRLEDNVYEAGIDTTFALYKPYTDYYMLHPSIRTGRPYTAKHLPWYVDSSKIDPEEAFYRMHARQDITSWNTDEILERYKKELIKK